MPNKPRWGECWACTRPDGLYDPISGGYWCERHAGARTRADAPLNLAYVEAAAQAAEEALIRRRLADLGRP